MTTSITGKIVEVLPARSGVSKSGNEWVSQDFIIEEESGDKVMFNVFGANKIAEYNLKVGTTAAVTLKVESASWNGKYFTKVTCLNCMSSTANQAAVQSAPAPQLRPIETPHLDVAAKVAPVKADELPF